MSSIQCQIVSAEEEIFSGEVAMVFASGEMGELGIAPRHTPLLTRLKPGQVRVQLADGSEEFYYVSGGLIEVQPFVVTVLADTAMRAHDIDEAAAQKAKEEAEKMLADKQSEMEVAQAQAQLAESLAQLAALQRLRKTGKRK